jgi:hypothetical protein
VQIPHYYLKGCIDKKMKTTTITSFDAYMAYTESLKGQYYFRGQADKRWTVIPSLFRRTDIAFDDEKKTVCDYMKKNPTTTPLSALFNLQHYGTTPTRICDLTISPMSALFFAAEKEEGKDGVVFVIGKEREVGIDCPELQLFSNAFASMSNNLRELAPVASLTDNAETVLSNNYLVRYEDLIYNNQRSFRQGGTGLIFGFSCINGMIEQKGTESIDKFVNEAIIIPANAKTKIMEKLRAWGYSKGMLYNTFEPDFQFESLKLRQTKLNATKIYACDCMKVVADYRVSTLYFDSAELADNVTRIVNSLLAEYGDNARLFTRFYFDENFPLPLCMCNWNEKAGYKIEWTDNYISMRLHNINSQISRQKQISAFNALLKQTLPIYMDLHDSPLNESALNDFLSLCLSKKNVVKRAFLESSNIARSGDQTDDLCEIIREFLCSLDNLILEAEELSKRENENPKKRICMANMRLKECEKHLSTLGKLMSTKSFPPYPC